MAMNLGLSSPEMLSRMRSNEEIDRQRNQARRAGISGPALAGIAGLFGGGGAGALRTPQVMPQRPGGAAMGGGRPVSSSMGGMDPRTLMGNGPINVGPAVPPDAQRAQMEQMLAQQLAQYRAQQQAGQMNGPSVMGSPDQQLRQQMAMQQINQLLSGPANVSMGGPDPRAAMGPQPAPTLSRDQARQLVPGSMMGAPQRPGGATMGGGRPYSQPATAALDPRGPADPSGAITRGSPQQSMLNQQAQVWNALQQGGINAPWMAGAGMAGQYEPYRQQAVQQQAAQQPQTNVPPRYQNPGYLPPSQLQRGPTRVSGGPMWGPDRNPRPSALRADARNNIQGMISDSLMTRSPADYNTGQYRPPGGFNQTPDRDVNRQLRLLYNDMNKLPGFEGRTAVPDIPPANKPDDPGTPPTDPGTPPTDPGTPPTGPGTPPTDPGTPGNPGVPGWAQIPANWDAMDPRARNQWLLANTAGLQLPGDFSSMSRGDRIRWLRDNYPGLDWDGDGVANPLPGGP